MIKDIYRIKMDELKVLRRGSETICFCPWCYDREVASGVFDPKPDRKGKLYVSESKGVGFCFRCKAIAIITDSDGVPLQPNLESILDGMISKFKLNSGNFTKYERVELPGELVPASENEKSYNYLKSRSKIYEDKFLIDSLELKYNPYSESIIIPFKLPNIGIVSYQSRNINRKSFYNPLDVLQPIYIPTPRILEESITNGTSVELAFTEGCFDAISLQYYINKYKKQSNVVAIGLNSNSLPEHKYRYLTDNFAIDKIHLFLDDRVSNYNISSKLMKFEQSYKRLNLITEVNLYEVKDRVGDNLDMDEFVNSIETLGFKSITMNKYFTIKSLINDKKLRKLNHDKPNFNPFSNNYRTYIRNNSPRNKGKVL